jgi:hypothetical protein
MILNLKTYSFYGIMFVKVVEIFNKNATIFYLVAFNY